MFGSHRFSSLVLRNAAGQNAEIVKCGLVNGTPTVQSRGSPGSCGAVLDLKLLVPTI